MFLSIVMDLLPEEVARIVAFIEVGVSQREIARRINVSRATVQNVYRRYRETGLMIRRPGSGRRRKTSARDDRFMVLAALRNRHQTAVNVNNHLREVRNVQISEWTVRRRLRDANLKAYRPATGPKLAPRHKQARLQYSRNHVDWTLGDWSRVLFTDESRICLSSDDRRGRVLRRPGERYAQCTIAQRVSYGGGSVMVWGGICFDARTELVIIDGGSLTAQRYVTEILEEHVMPFAPFFDNGMILMQDNARPHTARITQNYLADVGIEVMDWPALSPDLNPIEHIWDELKKRVRSRSPPPENIQSLKAAVVEEWEVIPQETIQKLIRSMQNRLQETIRVRGGNTHY